MSTDLARSSCPNPKVSASEGYEQGRRWSQVFTREQLLDRVWDEEFYGDASTVTVHIRRLRQKIEPEPDNPMWVQTVWGVGYRFRATTASEAAR